MSASKSSKTLYTAIFSNYEQLREPTILTDNWNYICYTDQPFTSDVWEIIRVANVPDPRREARKRKALFFNYVPTEQSIWIDGSFQINCDLNIFWDKYFTAPFSAPLHPSRKCVYDEIHSVITSSRGGKEKIRDQEKCYRAMGVPADGGLISSGILLRSMGAVDLCKEWWNETASWSLRDQVSFAKVSAGREDWHTFKLDYTTSREMIYYRHKNKIVHSRYERQKNKA